MTDNPAFAQIKQEIEDNAVVLFMKGTPMFPQCGFSAAVVHALTQMGVKFKGVDVLTEPALREGVKAFADWPTIPQLYVQGGVRRRLRHRARNVRIGRAQDAPGRKRRRVRGLRHHPRSGRKGRPGGPFYWPALRHWR